MNTTQPDGLSKEEKDEINKKALEVIMDIMKLYGIEATPNNMNFALRMFTEGVKFVSSEGGEDDESITSQEI
jgi:hypothetical protein